MQDDGLDYAVGALASIVRDLCHVKERLEKEDFVRLANASSTILLCASGADDVMVHVRGDELATECAEVILEIWRKSGVEAEFRKSQRGDLRS